MAEVKEWSDGLVANISEKVKQEVLDSLRPFMEHIALASASLESSLGRTGRGRPRGTSTPVAEPSAEPRATTGKPRGRRAGGGKRAPQGALQEAVKQILGSSPRPIKLIELRDRVMETEHFRKGNPKGIYSQITGRINKIQGVQKTGEGYTLKAGEAAKKK